MPGEEDINKDKNENYSVKTEINKNDNITNNDKLKYFLEIFPKLIPIVITLGTLISILRYTNLFYIFGINENFFIYDLSFIMKDSFIHLFFIASLILVYMIRNIIFCIIMFIVFTFLNFIYLFNNIKYYNNVLYIIIGILIIFLIIIYIKLLSSKNCKKITEEFKEIIKSSPLLIIIIIFLGVILGILYMVSKIINILVLSILIYILSFILIYILKNNIHYIEFKIWAITSIIIILGIEIIINIPIYAKYIEYGIIKQEDQENKIILFKAGDKIFLADFEIDDKGTKDDITDDECTIYTKNYEIRKYEDIKVENRIFSDVIVDSKHTKEEAKKQATKTTIKTKTSTETTEQTTKEIKQEVTKDEQNTT